MTQIKSRAEIEAMREGGRMLAEVLALMRQEAVPGITPKRLAELAATELERLGGEPAFLGVPGSPPYPDVICISVNNQVQHAIPSDQLLEEGDVVNFDFGVRHKGMITDGGISVGIGAVDEDAQRLLEGTKKALAAGLKQVKDGCRVGDISAAIEEVLHRYQLGIVRTLVGHGVGHELHEDPNIPNFGRKGTGPVLKAGMTVAIEPISTLGSEDIVVDNDGWTLWTADASWSAQFEHTVLVTDKGCEILTITSPQS